MSNLLPAFAALGEGANSQEGGTVPREAIGRNGIRLAGSLNPPHGFQRRGATGREKGTQP